jgi:hypothetical protein
MHNALLFYKYHANIYDVTRDLKLLIHLCQEICQKLMYEISYRTLEKRKDFPSIFAHILLFFCNIVYRKRMKVRQ